MYHIPFGVLFGLTIFCVLAVIVTHILSTRTIEYSKTARLPGPPRLPLIGNALDMPATRQEETFARWKKVYGQLFSSEYFDLQLAYATYCSQQLGDAVQLTVLGQDIIILTSHRATGILLQQRGSISADRPNLTLFRKWAGFDWVLVAMGCGPEMHRQRRLTNQCVNRTAARSYEICIHGTSLRFCVRLLNMVGQSKDDKLWRLCERFAEENVMRIAYGYDVTEERDPIIQIQRDINKYVENLGALGSHPVDIFPIRASYTKLLLNCPSYGVVSRCPKWIFGFKFARRINALNEMCKQSYELPFQAAKARIRDATDLKPSMVESLSASSTEHDGHIANESSIKAVVGQTFNAANDTISQSLKTFVLAMTTQPDVQAKAQSCLDLVLRGRRLPDFRDRGNPALIYIEACILECMRWRPTVPFGVPHLLTEDTIFDGVKLKKGTMLMAAVGVIAHDKDAYVNPELYDPDRWIAPDGKSLRKDISGAREIAFGYGRRVCPGRHIAESTLWITAATLLTVFGFSKASNELGNVVEPDLEYEMNLFISRPRPYPCYVELRSQSAGDLLAAASE